VQGSNLTLTAVPGVRVGHATDTVGATGCTAILVDGGAAAAARVLGGAVGSRQFAALEPGHVAPRVHGVLLAGGSAFGLDAGGGALRFLEERGIGLATPAARVPIVPTLVIYDLGCGDAQARPDAAMGYAACAAASAAPVAEGCVGAGTGATVGKLRGVASATKGGVGSAVESTADGVVAGALVVCNAFGDVVDPRDRRVVAGARADDGRGFLGTSGAIVAGATNAALDRDQVGRAAALAATALPLCIDPVHTMLDGDVVVGLATGAVPAEPHQVGLLWRAAILAAVLRAVTAAETLHGVPAARDLAASAVRT
jgi:L-aminopeptidase/D-esterase-like protein